MPVGSPTSDLRLLPYCETRSLPQSLAPTIVAMQSGRRLAVESSAFYVAKPIRSIQDFSVSEFQHFNFSRQLYLLEDSRERAIRATVVRHGEMQEKRTDHYSR